jgi:hypothetical protein
MKTHVRPGWAGGGSVFAGLAGAAWRTSPKRLPGPLPRQRRSRASGPPRRCQLLQGTAGWGGVAGEARCAACWGPEHGARHTAALPTRDQTPIVRLQTSGRGLNQRTVNHSCTGARRAKVQACMAHALRRGTSASTHGALPPAAVACHAAEPGCQSPDQASRCVRRTAFLRKRLHSLWFCASRAEIVVCGVQTFMVNAALQYFPLPRGPQTSHWHQRQQCGEKTAVQRPSVPRHPPQLCQHCAPSLMLAPNPCLSPHLSPLVHISKPVAPLLPQAVPCPALVLEKHAGPVARAARGSIMAVKPRPRHGEQPAFLKFPLPCRLLWPGTSGGGEGRPGGAAGAASPSARKQAGASTKEPAGTCVWRRDRGDGDEHAGVRGPRQGGPCTRGNHHAALPAALRQGRPMHSGRPDAARHRGQPSQGTPQAPLTGRTQPSVATRPRQLWQQVLCTHMACINCPSCRREGQQRARGPGGRCRLAPGPHAAPIWTAGA